MHNVIKALKEENGEIIVDDDDDILNNMCKFYENLYRTNNIQNKDIKEYLNNIDLECTLEDRKKKELEIFPTLNECSDALFNMKKNKSPGLDGIPCEFYQTFWDEIKQHFYCMLKSIFDLNTMTFTQRLSLITLIHKKRGRTITW